MTVTGTKQTVDIESEMSGYSVSFGNVFNPFVTGAVAYALPNVQVFNSEGKQHITQYTPSFMYFKDAHYNVDEMHLENGIITGESSSGKISVVIEEHLKNRVEQYSRSRSFSMNPGAMLSFGMTPGLINGMMTVLRFRTSIILIEFKKTTGTNANKKAVHLMDSLIKKDEVDLTDLTNGLNTAYVTLSYFRKKGISLTHSLTEKAMISLTSLRKIKVKPKFKLDSITNKSIYKKENINLKRNERSMFNIGR